MEKRLPPAIQSPHVLDFISHSAAQTERIGQRLAEHMQPGDVVLLIGNVGVGKTQLVKGIVQGLGSPDMVTSPSFVLMNEYESGAAARRGTRIYHIDLYRIGEPAEITTIGMDDVLNPHDICLVEWAERAETLLPADHLALYLQYLGETKRVLRFEPHGARYVALVDAFKHTAFG